MVRALSKEVGRTRLGKVLLLSRMPRLDFAASRSGGGGWPCARKAALPHEHDSIVLDYHGPPLLSPRGLRQTAGARGEASYAAALRSVGRAARSHRGVRGRIPRS